MAEASLPPTEILQVSRRELLGMVGAGISGMAALALEGCSHENDQPGEPIEPHVTMETKEVVGETDLLRSGSWQNMAGARAVAGGLELTPTGLAIRDKRVKNEAVYTPDPPLEVFGPRLQVNGDFALNAQFKDTAPVSLQLYGEPPLRFDDFRYERSRIECSLGKGADGGSEVNVRAWDGSSQQPTTLTGFTLQDGRQLEVRRQGNDIVFLNDGKTVGQVSGLGTIFNSGQVWLGLNGEQGRATATSLTAQPLNGHRVQVVDTSSLRIAQGLPEPLQGLVRKPGFRIGAAVALNPLVSDPHYAELFLGGELGSITTENALKPQDTQPLPGVFTFGDAEALVQLAGRHGLAVHGHTLMYSKAMPEWMATLPYETAADKQRLRQILETHIKTVVGQFRGRIATWDVANEIIDGFNGGAKLEENIFYKAFGEEYLDIAFRAAHEADPQAKLFINDNGMETNPQGRGKFMVNLAKRLLARGVPFHGIGIQGHVYEMPRDTIDPRKLRGLVDDFGALDLLVRVSELDVTGKRGAKAQADQYASVLKVGLQAPNCIGVTIWGLDDGHGSTAGVDVRGRLNPGNALPYTADYRPKLARRAMQGILRAA